MINVCNYIDYDHIPVVSTGCSLIEFCGYSYITEKVLVVTRLE